MLNNEIIKCSNDGQHGRQDHPLHGVVAHVLLALAHQGVELVQPGGVALILVLYPPTVPDHGHIAPHLLVDPPADGVLLVLGAGGGHHVGLDRVCAVWICHSGALVAGQCISGIQGQDEQYCDGDQ